MAETVEQDSEDLTILSSFGHIEGSANTEDELFNHYRITRVLDLARWPAIEEYLETPPEDIAENLQLIFRLSFKYSAGAPWIQSLLQARTVQLMAMKYGSTEPLREAAESLEFDASSFHIPKQHAKGFSLKRAEQRTAAIWDFYMSICTTHPDDIETLPPLDKMQGRELQTFKEFYRPESIAVGLATAMVEREAEYMQNGRPNKDSTDAKYKSYVREHGVLGSTTGNREFDVIFKEIGSFVEIMGSIDRSEVSRHHTYLHDKTESLVTGWESTHDQPFFPEGHQDDFFNRIRDQLDRSGTT